MIIMMIITVIVTMKINDADNDNVCEGRNRGQVDIPWDCLSWAWGWCGHHFMYVYHPTDNNSTSYKPEDIEWRLEKRRLIINFALSQPRAWISPTAVLDHGAPMWGMPRNYTEKHLEKTQTFHLTASYVLDLKSATAN